MKLINSDVLIDIKEREDCSINTTFSDYQKKLNKYYKLAGFDVIGFNEIDHKMSACYIENHKPKYSFIEPIQTFKDRKDLPKELYEFWTALRHVAVFQWLVIGKKIGAKKRSEAKFKHKEADKFIQSKQHRCKGIGTEIVKSIIELSNNLWLGLFLCTANIFNRHKQKPRLFNIFEKKLNNNEFYLNYNSLIFYE